ncbi:MAG: type III-B CRISPR module RAMP protein Cmr1 [Euryarchaeota archaeon]|nr:type III-B CRISPR module RAMP protein Cmr1 [Euryarchaeota archaeon]
MQIKIQTLTPLWTGGVDGKMDRIHETGIIGSMRWWYEAIVRGLGGRACDPSKEGCIFDAKKYRQSTAIDERHRLQDAGLCDVCQIFGATGWKRRFRISIVDRTKPIWAQENRMLNIRPPDRTRGWYLPPGWMGELILKLEGDGQAISIIASLFLFLEKWGNIGAKPQLGYGVFKITNLDIVYKNAKHSWYEDAEIYKDERHANKEDRDLPNFRYFGFMRYHFQPQKSAWWTNAPGMERASSQVQPIVTKHKTIPLAPSLKNEWRFRRWRGNRSDEMFGALQLRLRGESVRVRSKVAVSWAYPQDSGWEMRGWAWLQKSGVAPKIWDLMRDESTWRAALKVQGQVKAYPSGEWNEWATNDIAEFLERSKW